MEREGALGQPANHPQLWIRLAPRPVERGADNAGCPGAGTGHSNTTCVRPACAPVLAPPAGLEPATHGLGNSLGVLRCAQGDAKRLVRALRSRRELGPAHPISVPRRAT